MSRSSLMHQFTSKQIYMATSIERAEQSCSPQDINSGERSGPSSSSTANSQYTPSKTSPLSPGKNRHQRRLPSSPSPSPRAPPRLETPPPPSRHLGVLNRRGQRWPRGSRREPRGSPSAPRKSMVWPLSRTRRLSGVAPKPVTGSPPTGTKNSCSTGAKTKRNRNRELNQKEPFPNGFHLSSLFEEDECFVEDEYALMYAQFCSKRATALQNKRELCHICFFDLGKVVPVKKDELEHHCWNIHKTGGFLCKKEGCFIRTSSLGDAGRHHHFCHDQQKVWWVQYLKRNGET